MSHIATIVLAGCLATGFVSTASADSQAEGARQAPSIPANTDSGLGAEYEKLLRMVEEQKAPVQKIDAALDIAGRPGIGQKNVDVILVEFGDFQCPYCRRHFLGVAQKIHENLVKKNLLRYVFLDFPEEDRHPFAAKAAAAARCAEKQGKYWEMRNVLYRNQKALQEIFLSKHAKTAGMDETLFSRCLESGRYETAIRQDKVIGDSLGIRGTPTFFIGINNGNEIKLVRKIQGAQPYEVFEQEILRAGEIAAEWREKQHRVSQAAFSQRN
ncbi:MAG: thioredoxin domain-containing protein [Pseudomonadota bacterium]